MEAKISEPAFLLPHCRGGCIEEGLSWSSSWVGQQCCHCQPHRVPQPIIPGRISPPTSRPEGEGPSWPTAMLPGLHGPHLPRRHESAVAHQERKQHSLLCAFNYPSLHALSKRDWCLFSLITEGRTEVGSHDGRAGSWTALLFRRAFSLGFPAVQKPVHSHWAPLYNFSTTTRWSYLRSFRNGILDD